MLAAQTTASPDSLVNMLVGFGALALFSTTLVVLHVRRWRQRDTTGRPRARQRGKDTRRAALPAASEPSANSGPRQSVSSTNTQFLPPIPPDRGPTPPGSDGSAAPKAGSPAGVSPDTLAPLAERLDRSRRLAVAENRVAEALAALPHDRWWMERHVALGGHRIPFLIAGETGVFVLWAVDRGPGWDDLAYVNDAAALIKLLLPGYRGEVQPGLCRAFQPTNPRWWYRPGSTGGAWVLGINSLQHWLAHFGTQHGLSPADLRRLNQLAGPHWQRRPTGRSLPPTPNVG